MARAVALGKARRDDSDDDVRICSLITLHKGPTEEPARIIPLRYM